MTPIVEAAAIVSAAAITGTAIIHSWTMWTTHRTRHTWTDPVNRLTRRVTTIERRVTNLEEKP